MKKSNEIVTEIQSLLDKLNETEENLKQQVCFKKRCLDTNHAMRLYSIIA
jgi:hypothetical protein